MKKLVVLTGAGISAESGISTFRDSDGMWEKYPVMDVASHTGFVKNPALIHEFYNNLRRDLVTRKPNHAHEALVDLEKYFDVDIITQNVDNLHEMAGSKKVLHLHGELMKVRSMRDENLVYTLTQDNLETSVDTRINGDPVRPHIVFFEEAVPNMDPAIEIVRQADILVVIGTSLVVYPAASLLYYVKKGTPIYYIDPKPSDELRGKSWLTIIDKKASQGVDILKDMIVGK